MNVGFLITNNGTHSPEKWAVTTASQIINIASTAEGEQALAGRKLELKLLDILEEAHKKIQEEEKACLESEGMNRCDCEINIFDDVESTLTKIIEAAQGTIFQSHFESEEVKNHIWEVLRQHFSTVVAIERDWLKSNSQ